jgi:NTP pyrophosphatase (non-canonical NTP hydrolase)
MESLSANVGQKPLDEFVDVVAKIYSAHDKHRSIWDVWCHTLHHAAGVAEHVRKGETEKGLRTEIADFSLWLFTAVLKLRGKFGESKDSYEAPHDRFIRIESTCSDLLWHKYPKTCPFCSAHRIHGHRAEDVRQLASCECRVHRPETESPNVRRERINALRNYSNEVRGEKPASIDEWQKMFGVVFGANLNALSLIEVGLHLMEELGEASDAMIRMCTYTERTFADGEPNSRQSDLESELADVFSQLFALVEKLDLLERISHEHGTGDPEKTSEMSASVRLSKIIWDRYGSNALDSFYCSTCKAPVCCCQIVLVPATHSARDLIQKFV